MPNVSSASRDRAAAQDYRTGATFLHAAAAAPSLGDGPRSAVRIAAASRIVLNLWNTPVRRFAVMEGALFHALAKGEKRC
jgi:hypothetical protein